MVSTKDTPNYKHNYPDGHITCNTPQHTSKAEPHITHLYLSGIVLKAKNARPHTRAEVDNISETRNVGKWKEPDTLTGNNYDAKITYGLHNQSLARHDGLCLIDSSIYSILGSRSLVDFHSTTFLSQHAVPLTHSHLRVCYYRIMLSQNPPGSLLH